MVFTPEQLQEFREIGYTTIPDFYTPREVEAMVLELERFKQQGILRNVATEGDGRTISTTALNLQVIPVFPHSTLYRAAALHAKLVAAVTELLGEPTILHLDQIFLKPARHGRGTAWHQDNAYFRISDPTMGVGTWTALHAATVANGTMHMIPNAFREKFRHQRDPNSDHHITMDSEGRREVPIELPAGGVLFFNYGVPHCTKGNQTDRERAGFAMHFLRGDYAPAELIAEDRHERPWVNGPKATGGEREYGVRVAGTWEEEVEKVLARSAAAV